MGGRRQRPFPIHLLQAPQSEAFQSPYTLVLAKKGLDDSLAQGVDRLSGLGALIQVRLWGCGRGSMRDTHPVRRVVMNKWTW